MLIGLHGKSLSLKNGKFTFVSNPLMGHRVHEELRLRKLLMIELEQRKI